MGWPSLIVFERHAESEGNVKSVNERAAFECSTHDYALTSRGRAQARITGNWIRETFGKFDVRYTSYYRRARETMALCDPQAGEPYIDPRLAEGQRGIYHVLTHAEMEQLLPWELKRRQREGLYHYRPLGGENWPDIELRIHSFLGTLARDCDGKKVHIVVHGHWLILCQRLIHHFSIEKAEALYAGHVVENASVTVYRGQGPWYAPWQRRRLVRDGETVVPWEGHLPPETKGSPA